MTMREIDEAACKGLHIVWRDAHSSENIAYKRVLTAGYKYKEGKRIAFVELLDSNENGIAVVNPEQCEVLREE